MNASVAQWLNREDVVPQQDRISQDAKVGRAGDIDLSTDSDGTVRVGGATTTLFQGTALA
ncbi:hypothetical protein BSP109_02316 [Brevibacterium sp. Mu109]|uniref:hypothetical protein n=1 Tax=Brevibacterium TaxID=1696 RepID=UPI000C5D6507|nr:hypothetical protein [Brevibacterium sp. Mu109]SMX88687.1 hypothetical protein BSP109_02316 [Brevibacterium sp. Mu109]